MEDRNILCLLSAEPENGILALEDKYGNLIKYIIRNILYQYHEDMEECYQDVLLRCVEKHREYHKGRGSFQTWLTIITKHIAMDRRKQIERRQNHMEVSVEHMELLTDTRQEVEGQYEKQEEYRHMFAAIEKLPGREKDMFFAQILLSTVGRADSSRDG